MAGSAKGTVLKLRRRGALARRFINASRCVGPAGVNADSAVAAAALVPADARPTAPAAMLKPKVVNTSLLPVMIFMAFICCLLFKKWAPMAFWDQ